MCTGCLTNADLVLTSGVLGAASARVALRRVRPPARRGRRPGPAPVDGEGAPDPAPPAPAGTPSAVR